MNPMNFKSIVGSYTHVFTITTFETLFSSPEFTIEGIDDCHFQIQILEKVQPVGLQIFVKKSDEKKASAKITVSFHQKVITRTVDDWATRCVLANELLESNIGKIKIDCNIFWYGTTKDSSSIQAPPNLSTDFKNFHLNSSLSDLKISIDGEELFAHKVILAAHSPVFLSMFETDMKEKQENRIVIEGIKLNVMKIVLSILYTGCDTNLDEVELAKEVLIIAERYDMKSLKRLCERKLLQKLEVSNVMDILVEADNSNAETLYVECVNFIVRNKEKIAESEAWETLCHHQPRMICSLLKTLMAT